MPNNLNQISLAAWVSIFAQRGFQVFAQGGLVRKRVGGVAPEHDIFHPHLHGSQGLGVAVDVEAVGRDIPGSGLGAGVALRSASVTILLPMANPEK